MKTTPTKVQGGQRKNAGRTHLRTKSKRPQAQVLALGIMARAFCLLLLLIPAASTVSDSVQSLVIRSFGGALTNMTDMQAQTRASLLRRVASDTDAVRGLDTDDIQLLFGMPYLVRREGPVRSLHYTSAECALDVYYKDTQIKPVYVEYRLRGDGTGVAHQTCLQALFSGARFEAVPTVPTIEASAPDGRV
ncbi:MAG: hypothetical protein EBQ96_06280 [Proteobacteria bacterium]|nr:hypothetical protein [Pseudomonadota bacterium]